MRDRLASWYTPVKQYGAAALAAFFEPRKSLSALYVYSSSRYTDARRYITLAKNGIYETNRQLVSITKEFSSSPHDGYRRLLVVDKKPSVADFTRSDRLMLHRRSGSLIAYWLENEKICQRVFPESKVRHIVERLPPVDKEISDLLLLNMIKLQYDFASPMERLQNSAIEIWQGFSRAMDPANITKIAKYPNTRKVLYYAITANLWYLSVSLSYEKMIKGTWRYIPGMENSYPEAMLDYAASVYLLTRATSMFVDNIFYNSAVSIVSGQEEAPCAHFEACGCNTGKEIKGMLGSPFYLLADQLFIASLTNNFPVFGREAKFLLNSWRFGLSLLEYKLASKGMCTDHRYQKLIQNNSYAFGFGLSYLTLCNVSAWYLKKSLGVNSVFIEDAIASALFPFYIFSTQTIDTPLPGNRAGTDFFYLSRNAMSLALSTTSLWLGAYLNNPDNEAKLKVVRKKLGMFPPLQLLNFLLASGETQAIEKVIAARCERPAISLYLEYSAEGIKGKIETVRAIRTSFFHNLANRFDYYVPGIVPVDLTRLLNILLDNRLAAVLDSVEETLNILEKKKAVTARLLSTEPLQSNVIENYAQGTKPTPEQTTTPTVPVIMHPVEEVAVTPVMPPVVMLPVDAEKKAEPPTPAATIPPLIVNDYVQQPVQSSATIMQALNVKSVSSSSPVQARGIATVPVVQKPEVVTPLVRTPVIHRSVSETDSAFGTLPRRVKKQQ